MRLPSLVIETDMRRNFGIFVRQSLALAILACPGWVLAMGLPFASPPLVVEAKGMGNAVVADGTLFNASAYNPALLDNKNDFAEVHFLQLNLGNDLFDIASYAFDFHNFDFSNINTDNLTNLQNSLQNVNQDFQDVSNGLKDMYNTGDVSTYDRGVTNLQNAVNNLQTAAKNLTNKNIQVGAGLNIALKFDEHWGFQAYNSTQAAAHISRGVLISDLLNVKSLPTFPNNGPSTMQEQAAVSQFYYSTQSILNAPLSGGQTTALYQAVTQYLSDGNLQTFSNSVSQIMYNISTENSQQALFNDFLPLTMLVYSDTVMMATYCLRPLEADNSLTVGANFKVVNRRISSINSFFLSTQNTNQFSDIGNDLKNDIQKTTWRWGVDLGILYYFDDPRIAVGACATDLFHSTATLDTQPNDPLYGLVTDSAPTVVRMGASYKPLKELTLNADVDDLFSNTSYYQGLGFDSHINFGFNYDVLGFLQLRGGITNDNLCGGLGLPLGIQYAFAVDNLTQSYNHYLQFDVAF